MVSWLSELRAEFCQGSLLLCSVAECLTISWCSSPRMAGKVRNSKESFELYTITYSAIPDPLDTFYFHSPEPLLSVTDSRQALRKRSGYCNEPSHERSQST
jgi:hypothetical protein